MPEGFESEDSTESACIPHPPPGRKPLAQHVELREEDILPSTPSGRTYLVQVDDRLPEVVALLVEVSHADLSKVPRMVLVHVGTVMVLSSGETATTGMLAVLSYTTVSGGDVAAAAIRVSNQSPSNPIRSNPTQFRNAARRAHGGRGHGQRPSPLAPAAPRPREADIARPSAQSARRWSSTKASLHRNRPLLAPPGSSLAARNRRGREEQGMGETYCLRVLVKWVGILSSSSSLGRGWMPLPMWSVFFLDRESCLFPPTAAGGRARD